jgi:hypothetical protein
LSRRNVSTPVEGFMNEVCPALFRSISHEPGAADQRTVCCVTNRVQCTTAPGTMPRT